MAWRQAHGIWLSVKVSSGWVVRPVVVVLDSDVVVDYSCCCRPRRPRPRFRYHPVVVPGSSCDGTLMTTLEGAGFLC